MLSKLLHRPLPYVVVLLVLVGCFDVLWDLNLWLSLVLGGLAGSCILLRDWFYLWFPRYLARYLDRRDNRYTRLLSCCVDRWGREAYRAERGKQASAGLD